MTVPRIDQQYDTDVHVEDKYSCNSQGDSSHTDDGMVAPCPKNAAETDEEKSVKDNEDDEEDTPAIELVIVSPIMAVGAEERHDEFSL